ALVISPCRSVLVRLRLVLGWGGGGGLRHLCFHPRVGQPGSSLRLGLRIGRGHNFLQPARRDRISPCVRILGRVIGNEGTAINRCAINRCDPRLLLHPILHPFLKSIVRDQVKPLADLSNLWADAFMSQSIESTTANHYSFAEILNAITYFTHINYLLE